MYFLLKLLSWWFNKTEGGKYMQETYSTGPYRSLLYRLKEEKAFTKKYYVKHGRL